MNTPPASTLSTSHPSCNSPIYSPHRSKSDPFNCQPNYFTAMLKILLITPISLRIKYKSPTLAQVDLCDLVTSHSDLIFWISSVAPLETYISMHHLRWVHTVLPVCNSLPSGTQMAHPLTPSICSNVTLHREDFCTPYLNYHPYPLHDSNPA